MKKVLPVLLAVVLMLSLSVSAFAANLTPTVDNTDIKAGEKVTVTVNLDADIENVLTVGYNLYFDASLFDVTSSKSLVDGGTVSVSGVNSDEDGSYVALTTMDTQSGGQTLKAGPFAEIIFTAKADVTQQKNASFTVKFDEAVDSISYTTITTGHGAGPAATVTVTPAYSAAVSGDKEIMIGEDAAVSITVANGAETNFNAYQFTLTYDPDVVTYKSVSDTEAKVKNENGTLTIAGYGADKTCGTPIAVTFTGKASGETTVTLTSAFADKRANAVDQDTPAAIISAASTTITVNGSYTVSLPDWFTGADTVNPGADYTFTAKDPNYDYTFTGSTMGGSNVTVSKNANGSFTVSNVTGNLVIKSGRTPKTYTVTVNGSGKADATAAATAAYATDYTFTLNKDANYDYTVAVTIGGKGYTPTLDADGKTYTIAGTSITGDIVIDVTKTVKIPENTTVNFVGSGSSDIAGGKDQTATNGTDFTFTVDEKEGYTYTVKLGNEILTKANGKYTIPGAKITGTALTVTVEKTGKTGEKPLPTPVGPKPEKPEKPSEPGTTEPTEPGTTEPTKPAHSFDDVPAGAYYEEAVAWAAEKGITEGTSANTFAPKALCTRAQVVTFLWRAAGCPEPQNAGSFADVTAGSYYAKAVAWAIENGITGGTGDGMFSPDAVCTRAQAVTFLYRASAAPAVDGSSSFSDVDADAYYMAAVRWAEQNGITGGIGGGLFGSDLDCTREQIVTFIFRMMAD